MDCIGVIIRSALCLGIVHSGLAVAKESEKACANSWFVGHAGEEGKEERYCVKEGSGLLDSSFFIFKTLF